MEIMKYEEFKELNDKEKKEYLIKNGTEFKSIIESHPDEINGLEEFDALLTDEEKVEAILSYEYKGLFLFDKYSRLFDQTKRIQLSKSYMIGHDILRSNEYIFSDEEKKEMIKRFGTQGMNWFKKYMNLFSDRERAKLIIDYGVDGVSLFEENIEIFTDEEIVREIKKYSLNLTDLFNKKNDLFTNEEKKEFIIDLGPIAGAPLFEKYIEIFTSEERVLMIRNMNANYYSYKAAQILENRMEYFTDKEKVFLIKTLKSIGRKPFEMCSELFTDEEKFELISEYGEHGYELFKKYADRFTPEQKVKYLRKLFSQPIYIGLEKNRDKIYDVLNLFSKDLKKEEIERLLLQIYPDGKAVKFYNKIKFLPNKVILGKYPIDQIEKFDKKIWMRLAKNDLYYENDETKAAFIEAALSFGIFEKDKNVNERIAFLEMLSKNLPKTYEFIGVLDDLDKLKSKFDIISQKTVNVEYEINWGKFFEKEASQNKKLFKNYNDFQAAYYKLLDVYGDVIPEKVFKEILSKEYCTQKYADAMNTLMNSAYERLEINEYKLHYKYDFNKLYKENKAKAIKLEKQLRKFYWKKERTDMMTPKSLHRIFDGMDMQYKPGFFEFFKNHLDLILKEQDKQKLVSKIQRNWDKIVEANLGQKITFNKCEKYFLENTYKNVVTEDDKVIAKLSMLSGYTQEQYDVAKKIYEEQIKRKKSSIPLIEEQEGKNGYRYKVLRLNDPVAIFAGELNHNCQSINKLGESCMRHSVTSENGRVIVVLDENNKVLSESWLWRNQNVLCFDNIEAVQKDKNNRKVVGTEILDTVKRAAQKFLEIDQEKMAEWGVKQIAELDKKLQNEEITPEEYNEKTQEVIEQVEKQTLSKVTVGEGYTDVSLQGLEKDKEKACPIEYVEYIADSRRQYILAKNSDEIIPKDKEKPMVLLYEDGDEHKKLIEVDTSEIRNRMEPWHFDMNTLNVANEYVQENTERYINATPKNIHIIKFREEIYLDDNELEEETVKQGANGEQYNNSNKNEKSLRELQEEKEALEKKLEEARNLSAEYLDLEESQNIEK